MDMDWGSLTDAELDAISSGRGLPTGPALAGRRPGPLDPATLPQFGETELGAMAQGRAPTEAEMTQGAAEVAAGRMRRANLRQPIPQAMETPPGPVAVQLARGLPGVGSWTDEGIAAAKATAQPVMESLRIWPPPEVPTTWSERYQTNVEAERARQQQFEATHPQLSTVLGGVGSAAGGLGVAAAFPKAMGIVAGSMPWRLGAGAAAGAGWGGAYGAGQGETTEGRIAEGARGMALGSVVGAGAALPGALANRAAERAIAKELGVPRGAVQRVAADVAASEPEARAALRTYSSGTPYPQNEASMLADVSPALRDRAAAVAGMKGPGSQTLNDRFAERAMRAPERIADVIDIELVRAGQPAVGGGALTPEGLAALRRQLGPEVADRLIQAAATEAAFAQQARTAAQAAERGVQARAAGRSGNTFGVGDLADVGQAVYGGSIPFSTIQRAIGRIGGPATQAVREGSEATRAGVADLLTRQGGERNAVISRLLDHNARNMSPDLSRDALMAILMSGGTGQPGEPMRDRIWPPSPQSLVRRQAR